MEKVIKDGEVAVAVSVGVAASVGFGAGWSTWNQVNPMDARFNRLFLEGRHEEAAALCEELGLGHGEGAHDVQIFWVPAGEKFIITEHDGSESIMLESEIDWQEA